MSVTTDVRREKLRLPKFQSFPVLLLALVSFLVSPTESIPVEPQCPQFCYCADNFVTCTDFSFLDLSMIPRSADTLVLTNGDVEEIPPAFLATAPNLQILEMNSVHTRVLRGHAFIGKLKQ
ncbi:SLIT protein [Elysia marginata]|uniref:SLIT protein n=1 Tax=Elysia marginata TaxID=1093978 RepID=A0AAV4HT04_9GAST|nr:SLIT protein [Elysia marginata]